MRERGGRFLSDNTAAACPEIMAALVAANAGTALSYGADDWTRRLDAAFAGFFAHDVRVFPVVTGTAANALGLASIAAPEGAIYAWEGAHIIRVEEGAPEFFSGGARLVPIPGKEAKLTRDDLAAALRAQPPRGASALSLSNVTELGTVYRLAEIAALGEHAHRAGLRVQLDGARLGNAAVFLDCHPADLTWRAGVDVLAFGATKNGALAAEAVVFFDPALAEGFERRRTRGGHLLSKLRYVSAQLLAYLDPGVWRRNARRANALAAQIGASADWALCYPVEANQVFLKLDAAQKQRLRAEGFEFNDWEDSGPDHTRFVVSWDQPDAEVAGLCEALRALPGARPENKESHANAAAD
jgi:threonine aldolase